MLILYTQKKVCCSFLIEGFEMKRQWKNLRDSYVKYLKTTLIGGDESKRYVWSQTMEVFKPFIQFKPRNCKTTISFREDNQVVKEEYNEDYNSNQSSSLPTETNTDEEIMTPSSSTKSYFKTTTQKASTNFKVSNKKRQIDKDDEDDDDDSKEIPKKTRTELDATEMVFLGFAKTVKTFPPVVQARIKVKIAELLLDQEMEINESKS